MTPTYPIQKHTHAINGVEGRMSTIHKPQLVRGQLVHRNQKWKSTSRPISDYGPGGQITVTIRFDDECQNGHQSFSITAEVYTNCQACGCLHEDIAREFPELAPLIKWHLMGTDGPMHYIANTIYHAGDRDHNGLKAGERRQIRNGRTGQLCWRLETDVKLPQYIDNDTQPTEAAVQRYVPWERVGEGKARELDAARSCAVWPEATNEELSQEPEALKVALEARLPALIAEFRADMECIGFLWEPEQPTQEHTP